MNDKGRVNGTKTFSWLRVEWVEVFLLFWVTTMVDERLVDKDLDE